MNYNKINSYRQDSTGEGFTQNDNIGPGVFVINCQAFAGPPQTRLNLVGDPQNVVLRAYLSNALNCNSFKQLISTTITTKSVRLLALCFRLLKHYLTDSKDIVMK